MMCVSGVCVCVCLEHDAMMVLAGTSLCTFTYVEGDHLVVLPNFGNPVFKAKPLHTVQAQRLLYKLQVRTVI